MDIYYPIYGCLSRGTSFSAVLDYNKLVSSKNNIF
jgi:hypothetical protein